MSGSIISGVMEDVVLFHSHRSSCFHPQPHGSATDAVLDSPGTPEITEIFVFHCDV